jgi:hypothetical protein
MKIELDLDPEQTDKIVLDSLKWQMKVLKESLKAGEDRIPMFETDHKEDAKIIKEHIKAFKKVMEYYG